MTKRKLSTIVTSVFVLVALCFSMASCGLNFKDKEGTDDIQEENELVSTTALKTEFVNTANVKLMAASEPMMVAETGVITQRLTATVFPETASNKKVDWSVMWADASKTAKVSDFISVTPDSDGSLSATVTCKAAFTGNIIITVTTRQNGFQADCIVSFVGVPSNVHIITNLTPASDGYHVSVGNTYIFDTELSNPFGEVGQAYRNLEVSVVGVGTIKVCGREIHNGGTEKWYSDLATNLDISTIASKFIEATISTDGTITVNVLKSIESYYSYMDRIDSGRTQYYNDHFLEYVTNCYFQIVLTEPKSGATSSFNLVIDPNAVTGVNVSNGEMFF